MIPEPSDPNPSPLDPPTPQANPDRAEWQRDSTLDHVQDHTEPDNQEPADPARAAWWLE
jgi:hypothetical protein